MSTPSNAPKVGFVSLGCPKALVDSERILTQLRTEGYQVVPTYEDADVVVVNTCGFIDTAKAESLDAIGEAIAENGRVIVTGCMGVEESAIRDVHPSVLAVTGPQQYEQVVSAVHEVVPPKQDHNPLIDLVPPQGVKLTPRHYAYLKISEGCNHSCSFCIIPSMRGDLVSRPIGDVLREAEKLAEAGVDAIWLSNHAGRQFDGAPAALPALPAIRAALPDMPLIYDGGVNSGLDIARAIAMGADFVMLGKAWHWGLGAFGAAGADHVAHILKADLTSVMAQIGAARLADLPTRLGRAIP